MNKLGTKNKIIISKILLLKSNFLNFHVRDPKNEF